MEQNMLLFEVYHRESFGMDCYHREKNGIICTQESFWKRYSTYPYEEMAAYVKLNKLTRNLFNAYLEKFGEEKIWCTYSLTIEDDYSFHVDLGYEMPEGNLVEQHHEVYRNFFNKEYVYLAEKYPYKCGYSNELICFRGAKLSVSV